MIFYRIDEHIDALCQVSKVFELFWQNTQDLDCYKSFHKWYFQTSLTQFLTDLGNKCSRLSLVLS